MNSETRLKRIELLASAIHKCCYASGDKDLCNLAESICYLASRDDKWIEKNLIELDKDLNEAAKILN